MASSQQALRRALGKALEDLSVYTVTGGSTTTATILQVSDSTTNVSAQRFNGRYIYLVDGAGAQQQRRIVGVSGLTPSTGVLTVELAWTAPSALDTAEITGHFPVRHQVPPEQIDYVTLLNRALGRMLIPDQISVSMGTSETASLSTWAYWLDRPERVVRIREAAPTGSGLIDASWRRPQLELNADSPVLRVDVPFISSAALTLDVLRPAATWIDVSGSGTYSESTTGFTAGVDAQKANVSVEDFLPFGIREATDLLRKREGAEPRWDRMHAEAKATTEAHRLYDRTAAWPEAPAQEAA